MADFEREAELSITIPSAELRSTRDDLEDALSDIPVGVDATGGGGATRGNGDSSRERRRRRREFRWARQRTDDTERQVELLENIEGELTEGGLGGGGGLFGDLLGLGGEGAGIATDLGTSVVDAVAPALGSLVGTALGQQVPGRDSGGGSTRLSIEEPLGVTVENTPLAVEDNGTGPSVEVDLPAMNPTFEPVFQPTFRPTFEPTITTETDISPEFDLPDLNVGGGSDLTEPVSVIVENTPLPVSGRGGGTRRRIVTPPSGGSGRGGGVEDPLELIQDRALAGGATGAITGGVTGSFAGGIGALPGAALGGGIGLVSGAAVGAGEAALRTRAANRRGGGGGAPSGMSVSTGSVNVTMNVDVQSAVQQAVEQVRREQERQRQQLRRDLEGQISDLQRQISSGGRSGLGGSVT